MAFSLKMKNDAAAANRAANEEKEPFLPDKILSSQRRSIGKNRKILVVDDNPVVLRAFELRLTNAGFSVATTSSAVLVVSTAEEASAELIILDVNLEGDGADAEWTGFKVLHWLRRFPPLARIPVIIVSGGEAAKYKEKALVEGAVAYFQKPVAFPQLVEAILRALPQST